MLYIMQDGMNQSIVVDLRKKNNHADIFIQRQVYGNKHIQ